MTDIEVLAGTILDQIAENTGVTEFKRTIQHADGSHQTFRIDITEVGESHFVAALVRQKAEGPREEAGPTRFSRDDRKRFAAWLAGETEVKAEARPGPP